MGGDARAHAQALAWPLVTGDEAEEMITTLARTDRVAMDDGGELEYLRWTDTTVRGR